MPTKYAAALCDMTLKCCDGWHIFVCLLYRKTQWDELELKKRVGYHLPVPRHSVAITLRYLPSEKRRSVISINTFTDGRHNIRSRTILAKIGHLQYKSSEILNTVYNIPKRIYRVSILT